MKCPLCNTEMRIQDNTLVHRADDTYAYRMRLSCRSKSGPNFNKTVQTIYTPVDVEEDATQTA